MTDKAVDIIVLDDIRRFALHLRRYFDGPVTMGIGSMGTKNETRELLPTGDPRIQIWWVPAKGNNWKSQLIKIISEIKPESKIYILIDILGTKNGEDHYNYKKVLSFLKNESRKVEYWIITSYERDAKDPSPKNKIDDIRPKSPTTFRELRNLVNKYLNHEPTNNFEILLDEPQKEAKDESTEIPQEIRFGAADMNILVTGAGFEYKAMPEMEFGVAWTAQIIEKMFNIEAPTTFNDGKRDFNLNIYLKSQKQKNSVKSMFRLPDLDNNVSLSLYLAAESKDLDRYFDSLFQREYDHAIRENISANTGSNKAKIQAYRKTQSLRNDFRQAMLRDDWGIQKQSLDAVALPWTVWLTTNYTRFADRAIQLRQRHDQIRKLVNDERLPPDWRIISTATEASILMRELFFISEDSYSEPSQEKEKLLFKLHGDISHLHTMAISGQDKELFSTTGLPLANLSLIYQAAERYLISEVNAGQDTSPSAPTRLHWHIVGHGMKDQLLCETIYRVSRQLRGWQENCFFTFVKPEAQESRDEFFAYLGNRDIGSWKKNTGRVSKSAFEYLSLLRQKLMG